MAELIGQTIRNYRIEATLGAGGMGAVFRARHIDLDRPVALKVLHGNLAADTGFQARFRQEARSVAALRHPNIVEVFDFFEHQGQFFLAMEYLDGGSMRTWLRTRNEPGSKWNAQTALELLRQAAEALAFAHAQGIVHRDVKPDNMLLAVGPSPGALTLKLADFGLAHLASGIQTATGVTMGTPAYISPEQCQGAGVDGRSDLYSLGIVLYEVATGYLPFDVKSLTDAVYKHVHTPPPPPRQVCPELPAALETIILRCLAKAKGDRYATGTELAAALQAILRDNPARTLLYSIPPSRQEFEQAATRMQHAAAPPDRPDIRSMVVSTALPAIQVADAQGNLVQSVDLTGSGLTVGRSADNGLVLGADAVSRRHLRVEWDGRSVQIVDLGSSNGTFLENERLAPQRTYPWNWGQALRIGPFWLRVQAPARSIDPNTMQNVPITGIVGADAARVAPPPFQPPTSAGPSVGMALEGEHLVLTPGLPAVMRMTLANLSNQVQHLSIAVQGVPESWVQPLDRPIQLNPGDKAAVNVSLLAPRVPDSRAGDYPVTVRAQSRDVPGHFGEAPSHVTVQPFTGGSLTLNPTRRRAATEAVYTVSLSNDGNAPARYKLTASDDEQTLQYQFQDEAVGLEPGETKSQPLQVSGKRRWIGNVAPRTFTVRSTPEPQPAGATPQETAKTATGQLDHSALIPPWLVPLPIAALMALIPLLMSLTRPKQPPIPVSVMVTPKIYSLQAGRNLGFNADVANASNKSVAWSVKEPNGGVIRDDGSYVAPMAPGVYHVVATSNADPAQADMATITVTAEPPVTVTIDPRKADAHPGDLVTFKASVANSTDDPAITWSVRGNAASIDSTGVFTAPQKPGKYVVVAASHAKPNQQDLAVVTVTAQTGEGDTAGTLTVAIDPPSSTSLAAGGTLSLSATVNGKPSRRVRWSASGGQITPDGVFTALLSPGSYEIRASSADQPGQSAVLTVTVLPRTGQTAPQIALLKADPSGLVRPGTPVTLSWKTAPDGLQLSLSAPSQPAQDVSGKTSCQVTPDRTTTYTLRAADKSGGSVDGQITVRVRKVRLITVTIDPPPDPITIGDPPIALTARVNGVPSMQVTWSAEAGSITADGKYTPPASPGAYKITAVSTQDVSRSSVVTVNVAKPKAAAPTIAEFNATRRRFGSRPWVILTWSVMPDGVTLELSDPQGHIRNVTGRKSLMMPLPQSKYTLTATNESGRASREVIVPDDITPPVAAPFVVLTPGEGQVLSGSGGVISVSWQGYTPPPGSPAVTYELHAVYSTDKLVPLRSQLPLNTVRVAGNITTTNVTFPPGTVWGSCYVLAMRPDGTSFAATPRRAFTFNGIRLLRVPIYRRPITQPLKKQ